MGEKAAAALDLESTVVEAVAEKGVAQKEEVVMVVLAVAWVDRLFHLQARTPQPTGRHADLAGGVKDPVQRGVQNRRLIQYDVCYQLKLWIVGRATSP